MRSRLALSVIVLVALQAESARAQSGYWYWCEPARAYYPYVATCPVPWRAVNPAADTAQPSTSGAPARPAGQPTPLIPTAPKSSTAPGDALDDWCRTATLPRMMALCSDGDLRALAIERQRAFDEAISRLSPAEQKALLSDQDGWQKTYTAACGLAPDVPPSLPLTPAMKACMVQAGRARIAYLRAYSVEPSGHGILSPAVENARQSQSRSRTFPIFQPCHTTDPRPPLISRLRRHGPTAPGSRMLRDRLRTSPGTMWSPNGGAARDASPAQSSM